MNSYEKLKKVRSKAKKLRCKNLRPKENERIIAQVTATKLEVRDFLEWVGKILGDEYLIFIEYYYFKGYTEWEIQFNRHNKTDLSKLSSNLRTYKDNLRILSEEINK